MKFLHALKCSADTQVGALVLRGGRARDAAPALARLVYRRHVDEGPGALLVCDVPMGMRCGTGGQE